MLCTEGFSRHTQINRLNPQNPQTLLTSLLCILARTVQFGKLALDEAELGRQKNLVSFASPLEPLTNRFFVVIVQTVICTVSATYPRTDKQKAISNTQKNPNVWLQAHELYPRWRTYLPRWKHCHRQVQTTPSYHIP